MRRIETIAFVAVMALIVCGFCWNLWDFATTTSQADLRALAKVYLELAGAFALLSLPPVGYAFWQHRRDRRRDRRGLTSAYTKKGRRP